MIATSAHWSPEQWTTLIVATAGAVTSGVIAVIHELRYRRENK